MIFRTKRGAGGYQDGLPGGFSLPGQAGADDLSGQNAAQAVIRTAYRGDSACQDKPAQMIFRTKRGAGGYQDGLPGGFSLPGQAGADDLSGQNAAQAVIRTAYWGIQLARTKPRRRPLSGADDLSGQSRGAGRFQAQMIFRTKRGAGGYQDGLLGGGFSLPGQGGAVRYARTKRGAGRFQDKAQMIFQDKTRRRRLSGRLTGGDSACQDKARRR